MGREAWALHPEGFRGREFREGAGSGSQNTQQLHADHENDIYSWTFIMGVVGTNRSNWIFVTYLSRVI